jgi:hypothetical protein
MDRERFDQMARDLGSGLSRRGVARAITGAVIGGILVTAEGGEAGSKNRRRGKRKKRPSQPVEENKVAVCHYDADAQTWQLITVGQSGWDNGHSKHAQDYLLSGECCSDRDCTGGKACKDGACKESGPAPCTECSDTCPGDPENNPTKTVTFSPAGSGYCSVIVNLTGFAGCTEYTAEYWSAARPDGYKAKSYGNVTLGPTDLSGSSQTNLGTFFEGGYLDIRLAGAAPDFQWLVDC